jgi:hypothetical protein
MVRSITEAPHHGDFIITLTIRYGPTFNETFKVWASQEDTISTVKEFIGERFELFPDEMTLLLSHSHPYPLADEMRLCRLLVEHRHLTLLIHEGKEICYGISDSGTSVSGTSGSGISGNSIDDEDAWWGRPMPDRYISLVDSNVIFDFRYLSDHCIRRIRSWMYQNRNVSEIWLLGTHPQLMEILYAIAEDVLCLTRLHSIIIQNPENPGYLVPYKSSSRACGNHHKASRLEKEGLTYLYQHLLLDQYRNSAEEVELWVDGGLLPGVEQMMRYVP